MGQVAPVFLKLLGGQLADVGQALLNQLLGERIGLFKIIGAVEEPVAPVEAQPVDVLLDGVHILGVLLGGIGIVHTKVAHPVKLQGGAEVDGQGLAVADVQIAVGLRREPGVNRLTGEPAALGNVLINEAVDEIFALQGLCHK